MPKIKFTHKTLQALKLTDGKQIEYSDSTLLTGVKGYLVLLVGKKEKTFAVRYRVDGKRKRFALGEFPDISLKKARADAVERLVQIKNGTDPAAEKRAYRQAETFSDLWEQYLKSPIFKDKVAVSQKEEQRKYDTLLKESIGNMKLVDIRKKHLSSVLSPLAEKSPVSANRLFSLMSVLFKLAFNKDLIEQHPMFGMDKPTKEKPRHRHLKADEIKMIWSAFDTCRPNVRDIFRLILLTCQRPGEVMGMAWSEINFEENLWTLPAERIKFKKHDHLIPLSPQVLEILEARKDNGSKFVFPSNHGAKCGHTNNIHKARYKIIKDFDMDKWGAHDLRRTGRTLMSKIGIAPNVAERVLNHAQGKIEGTYDVYGYLNEKATALDRLGREIDRINEIGVEPAKVVNIR